MSTPLKGFCGPSYQLFDKFAAVERTVNWFNTPIESGDETKSRMILEPCPGNLVFGHLPVPAPFNQACRGLIEASGTQVTAVYGVNGDVFFRLDSNGDYHLIGIIANDGRPVSLAANGTDQIGIASAGQFYCYSQNSDTLQGPFPGCLGASFLTFQDGYFIVVTPNSRQFQISGTNAIPIGDGTQWDPANVSIQAGQADLLEAMISSREYLRLLGRRRSQVYQNVGALGLGGFPFQSYNETFIETGIAAPFSLREMGDSLIWICEDARGQRSCWRDAAFQPVRISTFAVEQAWARYFKVDDAIAFTMNWNGHLLYQVTFPSALKDPNTGAFISATWVYDATASSLSTESIFHSSKTWTERTFLTPVGVMTGRPELHHVYAFGTHLVGSGGGDGNPGAIYEVAFTAPSTFVSTYNYCDVAADAHGTIVAQPIIRDRITPHLYQSYKRLIVNRFELDCSRGVGLSGSPAVGANPQILLRVSRDSGETWGPEINMSLGQIGQFTQRVYTTRLGYARNWVFWIRYPEPTYLSIMGAEIDAVLCAS